MQQAADIYLRFHGPVHGGRLGCRVPVGVGRLGARRHHRRLLGFGLGRLGGTLDVLPVSLVGLLQEHRRTQGERRCWQRGSGALAEVERRRKKKAISRHGVAVSSPAGRAETLRLLEAGTIPESQLD